MTLAADQRKAAPAPHGRGRARQPDAVPGADPQPVEFWSTAAIRSALQSGDIGTWKRIAAALKRDPYGRTARQVEEILGVPARSASPKRCGRFLIGPALTWRPTNAPRWPAT